MTGDVLRGGTIKGPSRRATLATLSAIGVCAPFAAWAQVAGGLLPSFGSSPLSGGLRSTVESVLPGAATVNTGLAWTYSASLGVDVGLTQTSYGDSRFSGTSFTTIISPQINATGDTRRLSVRLGYSPQINIYAGGGPEQTYVSQNLNASATATIVPETLFLDVRAVAGQTSRFGGTQNLPNQLVNSNDAVQTYSFSVSPSFVHRFGGWGTFRASYTYSYTLQDGNNGFNNNINTINAVNGTTNSGLASGYGTTGNLGTSSASASFVTGENLNRFQYQIVANASQYGGGGATYQGSYQDSVNNTLSVALDHGVVVFASAGYQWLHYGQGGGGNSYRLDDPTWAIGATLNPNPDSTLTVQYGQSYGENTTQFSGSYAVTARLRVAANYSIGISTGVQQQQQLLGTTTVGIGGTLIDTRTGLPVVGANAFGSQYGLSRVKSLSISAFYLLNRDTFSASVSNQTQTTLVNSTSFNGFLVPANTSSSSTSGNLSWQHDLNPTTSLGATVSYGVFDNGSLVGNSGASQTTYGVSSSLNHTFTETLSGHVTYGYTRVTGPQAVVNAIGANYSQNVFLVGLVKTF